MGRPRKNYTERELEEGKHFLTVLYPDSETYDCNLLLARLESWWDEWFYILHDKDFYTEYDYDRYKLEEKEEPPWVVGELKKPHYHIIGHVEGKCVLGRAAIKFGVPSNDVQKIGNYKKAIQYLIHLNNPEKYQYDKAEVNSNVLEKLEKYMKKENDASEKARMILDYIYTGNVCTVTALAEFALKNSCWDEFRRGQGLYTTILNERING